MNSEGLFLRYNARRRRFRTQYDWLGREAFSAAGHTHEWVYHEIINGDEFTLPGSFFKKARSPSAGLYIEGRLGRKPAIGFRVVTDAYELLRLSNDEWMELKE